MNITMHGDVEGIGKRGARGPAPAVGRNAPAMIIIIESGVVRDILPTGPVEAVVVDLDMIENEDTQEQRLLKAVMSMEANGDIRQDDLTRLAACLVREYRRPDRKRTPPPPDGQRAA